MKTKIIAGIEYSLPQVYLLQETGIGTAEYAARTAYDSFDKSENEGVTYINTLTNEQSVGGEVDDFKELLNDIEHSNLLDSLAWVHHHHSVLEHTNLTYLIRGTSRGVLQEHARHRIQSITVQSTRYTMSPIINAFIASRESFQPIQFFASKLKKLDIFVITDNDYINVEIETIYKKLLHQRKLLGNENFDKLAMSKSSLELLKGMKDSNDLFEALQNGKQKRNVGDAFKHIVTDNWKVDMVVTMNLRALKNYFELRNSGAAWFQIQWLAQEMIKATPDKYLKLILKEYK